MRKQLSGLRRAWNRLEYSALKVRSREDSPALPDPVTSIAVFQVDNIGDMLMATPAIRALRRRFPEARITGLVNHFGLDMLAHNPNVDELIRVDHRRMINAVDPERPWRFYQENRDQILPLRRYRFDLGVSLVSCPSPAGAAQMLFWLAGIKYRVGLKGECAHLLHRYSEDVGKHRVEICMDTVRLLGADDDARQLDLCLGEEDREFALRFLKEHGLREGSPIVALNPGGNLYKVSRRWLPERFIELAGCLSDRYGASILLIGGPDEQSLSDELAAQMGSKPLIATGKTTIRRLGALLEEACLLITSDTGALHIADAVGTETIAIFGPTDPARIAPRSGRCQVARVGLPCSPCYRGTMIEWPTCPYGTPHPCMEKLSVDAIMAAADKILSRNGIYSLKS